MLQSKIQDSKEILTGPVVPAAGSARLTLYSVPIIGVSVTFGGDKSYGSLFASTVRMSSKPVGAEPGDRMFRTTNLICVFSWGVKIRVRTLVRLRVRVRSIG